MQTDVLVAGVVVSNAGYGFDNEYSYLVPEEFRGIVKPGVRVLVPFGKGNRRTIGLVTKINTMPQAPQRIKKLIRPADSEPVLNAEMLGLMHWLKENTFCSYFDAVRTMVPTGMGFKFTNHYSLAKVPIDYDSLNDHERRVVDFMAMANEQREIDEFLNTDEQPQLKKTLASLVDKGYIEENDILRRKVGDETIKMLRISDSYAEIRGGEGAPKLTEKQRAVIRALDDYGCASVKEICYMTSCTAAMIKRMVEKGYVTEYSSRVLRDTIGEITERRDPAGIELNEEQQAAFEGINKLAEQGKACGALLFGVTGSGKTAVFFRLINSVLERGRNAIMLVPEISLTPQMVAKFKTYFGSEIAVIHSSLSLGQRNDEFTRIRTGKARIVIGTRSAIFAPLENIGMIIIDEEGEHTYKSETAPRYHARDVAIQRCGNHGAVLVMASATPSLETYYYAKKGRFSLFELKKRYADAVLPKVEIVDMSYEGGSILSRSLSEKLRRTLDKGQQSILLLNRRGYNTYVSCLECKKPISCPNCSIPLTYHKKNNKLMCHYCGYAMENTGHCPDCGSDHLHTGGIGTQKIESELAEKFPDARVLRMDADTTFSRYSYEEGFRAFENGEYDIMLGTQMIAKGLNFPNVTLVGVVSLDKALFTGDFRSYEKAFSLLTQVAGRCGRGVIPGEAVLQTFVPDHFVLMLAAKQDYVEFYEEEIALRKAMIYPPFCDICVIGFSSQLESKAIEAADWFTKKLAEVVRRFDAPIPLRALGPAPCTLGRINGKYRYRLVLKCRNNQTFRAAVSQTLIEFYKCSELRQASVYADINGDIGL